MKPKNGAEGGQSGLSSNAGMATSGLLPGSSAGGERGSQRRGQSSRRGGFYLNVAMYETPV